MDEIKLMLRTVWMMVWGKNVRLVTKVEEHQRRMEGTQEELKDYLSQISDENLSEEDVDWKFIVLDFSQELTAIGTLIRRDLCDAAIRQIQLNQELTPDCLRRINSQLTSLAYAIVRDSTRSGETTGHGPELDVEEALPAEDSAKRETDH